MTTRQNQVTVIKAFLSEIKNSAFTEDYKATDEEAMGLLLSNLFEWNGKKIMTACAYGLEDANYHTECKKIMEMVEPERKQKSTWQQVIDLKSKDTRHKGIANTLTQDEIETIIGTLDFFGADYKQTFFDLKIAKYRVFDWLAMAIQGRIDNENAVKVLTHSFIKSNGDIDAFIKDLRETDYDIDHSWVAVDLGRN